jgi:hypothetical protein
MNLVSIAASLLLVVAGRHTFSPVRRGSVVLMTIVGLFFVSAAWSMDPAATIRRAVNYAITIARVLGIGSPRYIMRITRAGLHRHRRQLMGKKRMFGWPTASQMGSALFLVVGRDELRTDRRISSIRPLRSRIG